MLPQGFIDQISKYPSLHCLKEGLLTPPEVSIRINPAKIDKQNRELDLVPWCDSGIYLNERPAFTFDPAMHQGLYYVQDASSMAITAVLNQIVDRPIRYLDACAAPGGKTTAAISALPEGSVVIANEYDFRRAEILAENVSKWGYPDVLVSRGDTSCLGKLRGLFDVVSVDAPCSGEGMMRKDTQAVSQWSPQLVESCARTQREILNNVWQALRPGGYLIYSTCTFNVQENEQNLEWLISEKEGRSIKIEALEDRKEIEKGICTQAYCYRFLPGKVRGEGLFLAVVQKSGNAPTCSIKSRATKTINGGETLSGWVNTEMDFITINDEAYGLPKRNSDFMRHVSSMLNTLLIGVHIASIKGKDIKPTHELALCTALNAEAFTSYDLSYPEAIKYLQRENLTLDPSLPKGNVLLTYQQRPLGFVKNLGNRSNSMMPKNWRIVTPTIPSEAPKVIY